MNTTLNTTSYKLKAELSDKGTALYIHTTSHQETEALLKLTSIGAIPVEVKDPITRVQGSIWAPELDMLDPADLLEGFGAEGVTAVFRPPRGPKAILYLTFSGSSLPDRVTAGYLSYRTRLAVPKPRRCRRCQNYGHGEAQCRGSGRHLTTDCTATHPACPPCGGSHEASHRDCPKWLQEMQIATLIHRQRMPPKQARAVANRDVGFPAPAPRREPAEVQ
ncbi:hypothetical protein FJT64_003901 [Amphibalanus amphitrite]|uniref:Nucleic-acid-binding protein from transposon X-element n=1 Tax=Amphibalanus amphitrite TaxID=1232801 RepID=A0A6A4WA94_AMPAM|nr:hypothetical protein FJT64_003901 [Amphibalanus amphitrite]